MWNVISILCIFILLCIFLILLESRRETHSLKVTHYVISTGRREDAEKAAERQDEAGRRTKVFASSLPPEFDGCRIMLLADVHNTIFEDTGRIIRQCAEEFKPDFILIAGDMIVCRANAGEENLRTADFVRELSQYADCYYGFGNHETGVAAGIRNVGDMWKCYTRALGASDTSQADLRIYDETLRHVGNHIYLMDNQSVILKKNNASIMLTGLNLGIEYYKRLSDIRLTVDDMNRLLGKCDKSFYNILMAHNPDYFETYAEWGADLVVSGHNHGGLLRLPVLGGVISPRLNLFPKYDRGIYHCNGATMVLSGGMGAHSVKIRVNNRPELICLELKSG